MNIFNVSRSISLWLLIVIFSFTISQAQNSPNSTNSSTETEKTELVSSSAEAKSAASQSEKRFSDIIFSSNESKKGYEYQEKSKSGNRELGFYTGSFTVHKDLRGESQKAPVVLFGLRYAWTTKNNPSHRLRYYMDFNPLIIVNYRERRPIQTSPTTTTIVGDRKTVFGVGFTPVGLQFNWRNSRKIQPYIAGGFGVAIFNKKFPDNRSPLQPDKIGNWFQLMPEFGAGIEIRKSEAKSYFIGYKYHHLSNGYTAPLNVGYNTNMVYAGMYFQRRRK
jgi:hypothetical protein